MPAPAGATPEPGNVPEAASILFGDRLPIATEYAHFLAEVASARGLLGPGEIPRLWERHLLNCAVVTDLCPNQAAVYDVGSGAGLPGMVWAIRRPDLAVTLLEPLLRRATFLTECVEALGLQNVSVLRARAEEVASVTAPADVVTARAVAPLDRLVGWTLPLVRVGGNLLALKGRSAANEIDAARPVVQALGGSKITTVSCGVGLLQTPTVVLRVHKSRDTTSAGTKDSRLRRARRNR
jgi:16S rRNA (guanine527-N7)-methyltransferase